MSEVDFSGLQRAADDIMAALDDARAERDRLRAEVVRLQGLQVSAKLQEAVINRLRAALELIAHAKDVRGCDQIAREALR